MIWTNMYQNYALSYRISPTPKPYYLSYGFRIEAVVGLSIGLIIGFVSALIGGFVLELVYQHAPTVEFVLIVVAELIVWLIVWSVSISFVVRPMFEVFLRLRLWHAGYSPLMNYRRFLDYAAERILLRKIGHYYIFAHILLRDYFASLDD